MKRSLLAWPGVALLFLSQAAHAGIVPATPTEQRGPSAGAPIPIGANVPLWKDFQKISRAWCKRVMLDEYHKTPKPDPKVAEFIQHSIDELHGTGPAPEKLKAEALRLVEAGVEDPLFLCLAYDVLGESRRDLYTKGMAEADKSRYNKIVFYMTSAALSRKLDASKAPKEKQETQFQISLKLLRATLQTDAFLPEEIVSLQIRLDSLAGQLLFAKHAAEVCDILRSSPKVPPWLTEYYEGKWEIDQAWKARGGDWGANVTEEGWKGFTDHLAKARTHLEKSWKLNPANPRAAMCMITVAMGEGEHTDSMRLWFDRAVAAQLDCSFAYTNLRWGLHPRWGGSIAQMISFGEECLRTGRYDTSIPYEYVLAITDVAQDMDDQGTIFADPKINQTLLEVLTTYLRDPNTVNPTYKHELAVVVAYKGGKMAVAKEHLEKINFTIKEGAEYLGHYVDVPAMIKAIRDYKPKEGPK